jgi:DNA repair exonuclease SbcCD ATPase subunit
MGTTDFFDDDLGRARKARLEGAPLSSVNDTSAGDEIPVRALSDLSLTRMAKHKQEVEENVLQASQELERLRKRQEELEREKRELEEIRRKQDEYQRGKRELIEKLGQSLVTMEKDEIQAQRMAEMLAATRRRFKEMLSQLQGLSEESWAEEKFGEELSKALTLVENLRMEFNKSVSRVEAAGGGQAQVGALSPIAGESVRLTVEDEKPFSYWLKVGVAVSLPLVITLLALAAIWLILQHAGLV